MNQESPPGAQARNSAGRAVRGRRWQDNADELGSYLQGEGWMTGLLVACSVERGVHVGHGVIPSVPGKTNPSTFATTAHAATSTVERALDAWDRLAAEGVVPPSSALRPVDVPTTPLPDNLTYPWPHYAARPERDYETERLRALANRVGADRIAAALPPEKRAAVVAAAVKSDPEVVDRVFGDRDAVVELNRGRFRDQERAAFNREARVIQNGGRIPTQEEEARENASPVDSVYQADQAMKRALAAVNLGVHYVGEAASLDPGGHLTAPHREEVRQMALRLMATLDETTEVPR